jgi:hypothetical protein
VQHHAAHQLDVEVALAEGALGGLANRGEGGNQEIVEGLAGGQLGAELAGAGTNLLIGEGFELGLEGVDRLDFRGITLDAAVVGRAEQFTSDGAEADHGSSFTLMSWAGRPVGQVRPRRPGFLRLDPQERRNAEQSPSPLTIQSVVDAKLRDR